MLLGVRDNLHVSEWLLCGRASSLGVELGPVGKITEKKYFFKLPDQRLLLCLVKAEHGQPLERNRVLGFY